MFKEHFLIFKESVPVGKLFDPRSTAEERARSILNANEKSVPFNERRIELAAQELHHPIVNTVKSIREGLRSALIDLPKAIGKKAVGVVSDITTSAIALPANIGRLAMDLLRLPPRIALIVTDKLAEETFGRVSRIARSINEKVHSTLGSLGSGEAHAMAH